MIVPRKISQTEFSAHENYEISHEIYTDAVHAIASGCDQIGEKAWIASKNSPESPNIYNRWFAQWKEGTFALLCKPFKMHSEPPF